MSNINDQFSKSGRFIKEDNTIVNVANLIEALQKALVVDKNAGFQLNGSNIIQPVDIQAHYQQTIQTHTNLMMGPGTSNNGPWIDAGGFNDIALTFINDAATTAAYANIEWSNDGATQHGTDITVVPQTSASRKTGNVPTKARYFRVMIVNGDTAPHTISAWAFLKA